VDDYTTIAMHETERKQRVYGGIINNIQSWRGAGHMSVILSHELSLPVCKKESDSHHVPCLSGDNLCFDCEL